jgi:carbohydrate-selective porin OprB
LGLNLWYKPRDWIYLSLGASNVNAKTTEIGSESLVDGELFSAAEIGFNPTIRGKFVGNYRFTYWHSDERSLEGLPEDGGWALSFDQNLTKEVIFFLRLSKQDAQLTPTRELLAGGVTVAGPVGQQDDLLGFGFAWGQPFDTTLLDQYTIEAFYRLHLTSAIEITPAIAGIFSPTFNPTSKALAVASLRVRVSL